MKATASHLAACATCVALLVPTAAPDLRAAVRSAPDVTLQEAGDNVILGNGILTATLSRSKPGSPHCAVVRASEAHVWTVARMPERNVADFFSE